MQVFYVTAGRREPIVGVVGALQFDVIVSRMQTEYNVVASVDPASYTAARWPADPTKALPHPGGKSQIGEDSRGRSMLLFSSQFDLEYFQRQHPTVELLEESATV